MQSQAYLFVGYSEKALFESVNEAVNALAPYMAAAEARCQGKVRVLRKRCPFFRIASSQQWHDE